LPVTTLDGFDGLLAAVLAVAGTAASRLTTVAIAATSDHRICRVRR
jgi:hypothetical protein